MFFPDFLNLGMALQLLNFVPMIKRRILIKLLFQFGLIYGSCCWGQEIYHLGPPSTDSITITNTSPDTTIIDSVNIRETIGSGYRLFMIFYTTVGVYIQGFNGLENKQSQLNSHYKKWPIVLEPNSKITISKIDVDFLDPFGLADYSSPRKYVYHEFDVRFISKSTAREIKVIGDVGLWDIGASLNAKIETKKSSVTHGFHSVDGKCGRFLNGMPEPSNSLSGAHLFLLP